MANVLDLLASSNPQRVQSDVGMAREGYNTTPYSGMSQEDLAALDRYSQGVIYGQQVPGMLGYAVTLPGAVVGAVAAELAKTKGGERLARSVASLLGDQSDQFKRDETSSPPSMRNILALLQGQAHGAMGDR